jgi:hypothetical protein
MLQASSRELIVPMLHDITDLRFFITITESGSRIAARASSCSPRKASCFATA